jgi:PII-like signaling protein
LWSSPSDKLCVGSLQAVYHTDKILRLSQDLPIVLEIIESAERIEKILPCLDEMVEGGLITLEKVRVILYRAAKK